MNKNKKTFFIVEIVLLLVALFFVWKIFDQDEKVKRVAVVLSEAGDKRWDSLLKGMKQAAKVNGIHLIICNTDEIDNAESEEEVISEQKNNNIDAFVVWPAPGKDTKEMLKKASEKAPIILIGEDLYKENKSQSSDFSVIEPNYYQIGASFGNQLIEKSQTVGIIASWEESQASTDAICGIMDTLKNSKSQIRWCCYRNQEQDIFSYIKGEERVDAIIILDPRTLDEIGEQVENGRYCGAKIYGVGSSMESIALQDYGRIKGLIVLDGYTIGYKSVEEISKKLNHKSYKMQSHETTKKIFTSNKKVLNDDIERFLYSYE